MVQIQIKLMGQTAQDILIVNSVLYVKSFILYVIFSKALTLCMQDIS